MRTADALKERLRKQEGFTLLEVLFAMVVATVGLLALALMQGNAIEGNATGNRYTQATFIAQDMLENIKDGNISTIGFEDMDTSPADTLLDEGGPDNMGPFIRSWRIESHTAWSRRIIVTVTWTDNNGARTVTLTSVSRGGGN